MAFDPRPEEDKDRAAFTYAVTGSSKKVEAYTGIPASTVRQWSQTQDFKERVRKARAKHQSRMDGVFTGLLDKLASEIWDRIENGEDVVLQKNGEIVKKKISAKDLGDLMRTVFQQRAVGRGEPTSITDSGNKKIKALEKKIKEAQNRGVIPKVEVEEEEQALH
jgi:antitoxin (DNA-binding transcriptional repressor) of toxin-antitoxin stability system